MGRFGRATSTIHSAQTSPARKKLNLPKLKGRQELTVLIYTVIEGYLESFCKWQSKENPEYWDKLSDHPDHWDHGLMLTGLDLYDGTKKQTSVIGKKTKL